MSKDIYAIERTAENKLFRVDEVNDLLFDLVDTFKNDAINAKAKAEKCYAVLNHPCFGENASCAGTKPEKLIESIFGSLLKATTVKKYALIVERFKESETPENREIYMNFPVGKLIILSPLTSAKNVENGYSAIAFLASLGNAENDKVREKHNAWEETNAHALEKIAKMRQIGEDEVADMISAQLTEEPEKPVPVDDFDVLFAMGMKIAQSMADKALKEAVADYLPKKAETAEGTAEGTSEGNAEGTAEETAEEKYARVKAEFAEKFAEFIAISEETGNKVTETMKQVARKVGVDC